MRIADFYDAHMSWAMRMVNVCGSYMGWGIKTTNFYDTHTKTVTVLVIFPYWVSVVHSIHYLFFLKK